PVQESPVIPVAPSVPRKRGRPRKYDRNTQPDNQPVAEEEKDVRGRGRPRKLDDNETTLGSRLV
ncbi:hypothetical protein BGW38_000891, partial [Lunasporangiospora selenospora]